MASLIEEYYTNPSPKVSLGEVVNCSKGKAVSKFVKEGNLAVINLVDITEIGIDYDFNQTLPRCNHQSLRSHCGECC